MREVPKKIFKFLEDGEELIYEVNDICQIEIKGIYKDNPEDTRMFIGNYGNIIIYFYFGEGDVKDQIYYFKQPEISRRIKYEEKNGVALCKLDRFLVNTENNIMWPVSFLNATIKLSMSDLNKIKDSVSVTLFEMGSIESKEEEEKKIAAEITDEEILRAKNVFKIYGKNKEEIAALNDVSIVVNEGDFISIMGPSGSGKSTLINILSTIDAPTMGSVFYKGKNLLGMSEIQISKYRYENLGFIFQDYNLVDNLTIKENIAVPLILASLSRKEILERVDKIAKKLDIEKILNKYPAQCSGGQCQRASCARALVTNPKIIIADEPTGNLDTKNSHQLLKMIQELNEEDGITVIMVTHDNMIASYSKKLLFIRDGKIDEILEREDNTQKEYFYKIVDIASKDSQNLIDIL